MDKQALETAIARYLDTHSICTIATMEGARPNASTVEFVSEGLRLFFVAIAGTAKVANLRKNPSVALTVNESFLDMRGTRGIQYYGKARLVEEPEVIERIRCLFFDKFVVYRLIHWQSEKSLFYEIHPERIDYIDYRVKFGHKEVWKP